jgi:release factor glutamine methyltransferase
VTGRSYGPRLEPEQRRLLDRLVARRLAGEPLQYLEGTVAFGPIEVRVDRRALIPRPETEQVWETAVSALRQAEPGTPIVDVGTGSGVLALALKHAFPAASVYGTDISSEALALATENAAAAGLEIELLIGDLFDPLPRHLRGRVELVVSNPPYVSEVEYERLPAEIRDHEPPQALVAGSKGTEVLARIAEEAEAWLASGGWLVCEIGEDQGDAVRHLFSAYRSDLHRDLAGKERILVARKGE